MNRPVSGICMILCIGWMRLMVSAQESVHSTNEVAFYKLLQFAKIQYDQGTFADSIKSYEQAWSEVQKNSEYQTYADVILYHLGLSYCEQEQYAEGIKYLEIFLGLSTDARLREIAIRAVIDGNTKLGNLLMAESQLQDYLTVYGQTSHIQSYIFQLAKAFIRDGQFIVAEPYLQRIYQDGKDSSLYAEVKILLQGVKNRNLSEQNTLDVHLEEMPIYIRNNDEVRLSTLYAEIEQAVASNKFDANYKKQITQKIASLAYDYKQYKQAISYYKQLFEMDLDNGTRASAAYHIAQANRRIGNKVEANQWYNKTINDYKNTSYSRQAFYYQASANLYDGKYKQAIQAFLTLSPTFNVQWELFWAYYLSKDWDNAFRLIEKINRIYKNKDNIDQLMYWLAKIYVRKGQANQALAIFEKLSERPVMTYYALMSRLQILNLSQKNITTLSADKVYYRIMKPQELIVDNVVLSASSDRSLKLVEMGYGDFIATDIQNEYRTYLNNPDLFLSYASLFSMVGNYQLPYQTMAGRYAKKALYGVSYENKWSQMYYPQAFIDQVKENAQRFDVDMSFIWSIMRTESSFRKEVLSPVGAIGLMQIMPFTGTRLAEELRIRNFKIANLKEVNTNIAFGAYYLKFLLKEFNRNYILAAAGYNAGEHRVHDWLSNFPFTDTDEFIEHIPFKETRNYAKKVMLSMYHYRSLYEIKPSTSLERIQIVSYQPVQK